MKDKGAESWAVAMGKAQHSRQNVHLYVKTGSVSELESKHTPDVLSGAAATHCNAALADRSNSCTKCVADKMFGLPGAIAQHANGLDEGFFLGCHMHCVSETATHTCSLARSCAHMWSQQ